ncbi:MAG: hypothetical protein HY864_09260 [Chloroflexi bacterium]|nr:hypothetical protein [Chloroflexota bacterium]
MKKYQPNEEDPPIIEFIAQTINEHLTEWYQEEPGLTLAQPSIHCYSNCFMLSFPLTRPGREKKNLLVKIRRHPKMKTINQAVLKQDLHIKIPTEFKELILLHDFFKDQKNNLGAIRPLFYIEQYHAIIMEEFESRNLRQLLMEWRTILGLKDNLNYLLDAAELTGQWLYQFHHKMQKYHEVRNPLQPIVEEINGLIERLDTASLHPQMAQSVRSEFLKRMPLIRPETIPYTNIHGDMTCDNVLYSNDGRVCMVDIKLQSAPIYSDIGLIMIHPDTFMPQIFSLGFFFRGRVIRAYRASFLRGYFGGREFDAALVNLYCAIKLLDKWVMYENIMNKAKSGKYLLSIPAAPLLRFYFKSKIMKYLELMRKGHQPV